ncbi:hypothetical protein ACPA9J_18990 [Pseudomonas aeruginosa]
MASPRLNSSDWFQCSRARPAWVEEPVAGSASARFPLAPAPARPGWPGCAGPPPRRVSLRSGAGADRLG